MQNFLIKSANFNITYLRYVYPSVSSCLTRFQVTLHYTECKSFQFNPGVYINRNRQDTSHFTHLPKRPTKDVFRRVPMILHTTSDNFVIFKHKRLKGNGKKFNTDHVRLLYGHTQLFQERNSRQNIKMIGPLDYFVHLYS